MSSINKAYTDLLMFTTLEVSEFCVSMNNYFKKNNIQPMNNTDKLIDMLFIQNKINQALEKHIFVADTAKKISDVEMLKLKYFKSSFDEFKTDIYKEYVNKKKDLSKAPVYNLLNYYSFFQLARNFTNKFDEVIDNWNIIYTPIIEKKLLTDLIEPVLAVENKTQNKI